MSQINLEDVTLQTNETKTVTISRDEYDLLCACRLYFTLIEDALYKDASLSWDKQKLSFDTKTLNSLMEMITKTRYWRVFMKLQEDEYAKLDKDGE